MGWKEDQQAAIAAQKAAHAALANGTDSVPAAPDGPLHEYNRAQTLDYLAQQINVLETGTYLPNATGPGLTILPGTERNPVDDETKKKIAGLVDELKAAGKYTEDEIAEASARLADNLANGVTLDPATAESV